jgi:hypothetical protein
MRNRVPWPFWERLLSTTEGQSFVDLRDCPFERSRLLRLLADPSTLWVPAS